MQKRVNVSEHTTTCFTSSHVDFSFFFFDLFAFGFPSAVLFILEQHVSQVLSEDYRVRKKEAWGTIEKKRVVERQRKGEDGRVLKDF